MLEGLMREFDSPRADSTQLTRAGLSFWVFLLAPQVLHAESEPRSGQVLNHEITSELRLSVDRGFAYLISEQRASGNFGAQFPVASNALVGLAFLAGGHTNREGRYANVVEKVIDRLLEYQTPNGYFDDQRNNRMHSRMYGHGFATLFLAQIYGMTGQQDERIRDALTRAIRLIERSQSSDGGWDYYPDARHAPELPFGLSVFTGASDTSITVCQTMALRAARNLGISVDESVVARARGFIEKAQNSNGGFAYRINDSRVGDFRESKFPRSAAGVCILFSLGDYNSAKIRKGFEYLLENYKRTNRFPFYAHYYCAQAMFQAGGRYWREYFPYVRDTLLRHQKPNGSWTVGRSIGGPIQCTAMALIVLQIPYRLLPIGER